MEKSPRAKHDRTEFHNLSALAGGGIGAVAGRLFVIKLDPGRNTQMFQLAAKEEDFSELAIMQLIKFM